MAWNHLQSASATANTGSAVVTYGSNVSAGTKLIAVVAAEVGAVSSIKDGTGNAMTQLDEIAYEPITAAIFAMDTPAGDVGTTPTITATLGSNGGSAILVQEVSGLLAGNTTAMIDGAVVANDGNNSGPAVTGAYSSGAAGEYLLAVAGDPGNFVTFGTPGGYTADPNNLNANNLAEVIAAYKNSTGGSESASFSLSSSDQWFTLIVAFKLAASATGQSLIMAPFV